MVNTAINEIYEKKYYDIVKQITLEVFDNNDCKIFLFGSRAGDKYRRDSDYDIGIMNIDRKEFILKSMDLEKRIEESIVPHAVDVINFDEADDFFKSHSLKKKVIWKN